MIKSTITSVLAATLVLGCGGGGSDGGTTSGSSTSAPATGSTSGGTSSTNTSGNSAGTTSIPTKEGDSYTYRQTTTQASGGSSQTYYRTQEFKTLNADSSLSYTETYSNNFLGATTNLSSTGSIISTSPIGSATPTCTFSGVDAGSVAPFAVGNSWDNSWTRTCGTTVVAGTNKGSIVGVESVTVPAGTFSAYKEVYTITTQQTSPASATINVSSYTCWRDTVLRKRVKCEWTSANTTAGSTTQTPVSTTAFELTNYVAQASSTSIPSSARFAGTWVGSFSGSDSGTCSNISIGTDGTVSGTCSGGQSGTFTVSGVVNSQGSASFSSGTTSGGAQFLGQFTSTTSANGTWSAGGASGTWTITHK